MDRPGLPHGQASLRLPSGATAVGEVEHGEWDGDVTVTAPPPPPPPPLVEAGCAADDGGGGGERQEAEGEEAPRAAAAAAADNEEAAEAAVAEGAARLGPSDTAAAVDMPTVECPAAAHAPCTAACVLCRGAGRVPAPPPVAAAAAAAVEPAAGGEVTVESYWKGKRLPPPGEPKPPGRPSEAHSTLRAAMVILQR